MLTRKELKAGNEIVKSSSDEKIEQRGKRNDISGVK
jgi:hypothetical protein